MTTDLLAGLRKVLLTTSLLSICIAAVGQTQIPNGGFENWNATGIKALAGGWVLSDETGMGCKTHTSIRTTDKAAGNAALLLQNADCAFRNPHEGFATIDFAMTGRPDSLKFMYKMEEVSMDTASVILFLWRDVNGTREAVADFIYPIKGSQSEYKQVSVTIPYVSNAMPDSAFIWIASDGGRFPAMGNKLWVDELQFVYGQFPASVNNITQLVGDVRAYPVPALHQVSISYCLATKGNVAIRIYDVNGKILMETISEELAGPVISNVELKDFTQGLYFFSVQPQRGEKVIGQFVKQ